MHLHSTRMTPQIHHSSPVFANESNTTQVCRTSIMTQCPEPIPGRWRRAIDNERRGVIHIFGEQSETPLSWPLGYPRVAQSLSFPESVDLVLDIPEQYLVM